MTFPPQGRYVGPNPLDYIEVPPLHWQRGNAQRCPECYRPGWRSDPAKATPAPYPHACIGTQWPTACGLVLPSTHLAPAYDLITCQDCILELAPANWSAGPYHSNTVIYDQSVRGTRF